MKSIQTGKVEVIVSLFSDDAILHIEDPKDSTEKLGTNQQFNKIARYEINTEESIAFLNIKNEMIAFGYFAIRAHLVLIKIYNDDILI